MQAPPSKTKLFVGHLPAGCTSDDLFRLFSDYGTVTECDAINKHGFVHFRTEEEAERAIKCLNNYNLMGSQIAVEHARSQLHRQPGDPGRAQGVVNVPNNRRSRAVTQGAANVQNNRPRDVVQNVINVINIRPREVTQGVPIVPREVAQGVAIVSNRPREVAQGVAIVSNRPREVAQGVAIVSNRPRDVAQGVAIVSNRPREVAQGVAIVPNRPREVAQGVANVSNNRSREVPQGVVNVPNNRPREVALRNRFQPQNPHVNQNFGEFNLFSSHDSHFISEAIGQNWIQPQSRLFDQSPTTVSPNNLQGHTHVTSAPGCNVFSVTALPSQPDSFATGSMYHRHPSVSSASVFSPYGQPGAAHVAFTSQPQNWWEDAATSSMSNPPSTQPFY